MAKPKKRKRRKNDQPLCLTPEQVVEGERVAKALSHEVRPSRQAERIVGSLSLPGSRVRYLRALVLAVVLAACGGGESGLTDREKACADNWETISHAEMRQMKRDRSIDGIYDWSGGYWVSYDKIMDIC